MAIANAKVVSLGERRRSSLGLEARKLQRPVIISKTSATSVALPVFISALSFSIAFHMLVVFGIKFIVPNRSLNTPNTTLEVVLVNSKSENQPIQADKLAQANLDGGGNTDEKKQAKTPLPVTQTVNEGDDSVNLANQVQDLETRAQKLMTSLHADRKIQSLPQETKLNEQQTEKMPVDLVERNMQVAQLEAQIARNMEAYQQRPKRQFIGARTKEFRFAQYVDKWREKIERVGTLNFPEEAKISKLYGRLQLTVAIKSDGTVEKVDVNRSSGYKVLDDAAKRIVFLSSPFPKFPDDIRRDTDILEITRTWIFTREDQLSAE